MNRFMMRVHEVKIACPSDGRIEESRYRCLTEFSKNTGGLFSMARRRIPTEKTGKPCVFRHAE
jgi:hypothetical protein